jgi:DNA-binding transcriptional ArsR family regulator
MKDSLSAEECSQRLKALADPERLRLIEALLERPQSVSDLAALLDNEIGNISHHLKILRNQGLVTTVREGKSIIYSLSPKVFSRRGRGAVAGRIDFGCCRIELPK